MDEISNISEANIVKMNRRHLFKIENKQKDKTDHNSSCNLPNKSFKIRSFTKKIRDIVNGHRNEEGCDIF